MRLVLNLASALAAFMAAWFWWTASRQPPPPASFHLSDRTSGEVSGDFQNWVRSSARANKRAASFAGVAAALQGAASVVR